MVAAVTGLWIMFSNWVWLFSICLSAWRLQSALSLFLFQPSSEREPVFRIRHGGVFAAVSFATGAGIPAYFYGTVGGGWGGQLSEPTWYLVALVILCMFSRKRWSEEEDEDGQDSADRDMVSLVWMG